MSSKSYMQPLDANFVREGQGQRDKGKQDENQQDKAKEASDEDGEVKFKPRGKGYSKALEEQDKMDPATDGFKHEEKKASDRHVTKYQGKRESDKHAMNLKGKSWAAVTHNEHTRQLDPDAAFVKTTKADDEAWERKKRDKVTRIVRC